MPIMRAVTGCPTHLLEIDDNDTVSSLAGDDGSDTIRAGEPVAGGKGMPPRCDRAY